MSDNRDNAVPKNIWLDRETMYATACKFIPWHPEYILKSTADDDKSDIVKRNNELTRIAEELEYKLEKILKPIREVIDILETGTADIEPPYRCFPAFELKEMAEKAIKETLEIANKAGGM
ncbi:MAG TPA: hypothetical protein ENH82_04165 [bacterium]|nr:hypothetical protein [bacterium]